MGRKRNKLSEPKYISFFSKDNYKQDIEEIKLIK